MWPQLPQASCNFSSTPLFTLPSIFSGILFLYYYKYSETLGIFSTLEEEEKLAIWKDQFIKSNNHQRGTFVLTSLLDTLQQFNSAVSLICNAINFLLMGHSPPQDLLSRSQSISLKGLRSYLEDFPFQIQVTTYKHISKGYAKQNYLYKAQEKILIPTFTSQKKLACGMLLTFEFSQTL